MPGFDDVIAAETVLSDVDGANGRLIIRGVPVEELARDATAESAAALLLDGFFEDMPAGEDLAAAIGMARRAVFQRLQPHLDDDRLAAAGRGAARRAGIDCRRRRSGDGAVVAGRAGSADAGHHPHPARRDAAGARSRSRPGRRHAADAVGLRRRRRGGARAGCLSGDGQRTRPERLDLRGPGRRFDQGRPGLGRDRRAQRPEGPAARRRARAGARHARRDRRDRRRARPGSPGRWRAATG